MADPPIMAPSPQPPFSRRGVRRISGQNARALERGDGGAIRLCTVNVGTMTGRSREVVEMLARRTIDVCCVQEVRFKGAGCRTYGDSGEKYKLWWSGGPDREAGVGVMVREDLIEDVIEVERQTVRIMKIKMVMGRRMVHIFSVYAPQTGRTEEEKEAFWGRLDDEMAAINDSDLVIIAGDMNGHVGTDNSGFEEIMGPYGYGEQNREGELILNFCQARDLKIMNTMFKKEDEKKITYRSGGTSTQIDYILMRRNSQIIPRDCKVIPGEECLTQHRMLVMIAKVKDMQRKKKFRGNKKIKDWKLREEEKRTEFVECFDRMRDDSGGWYSVRSNVIAAAKEVCGETTGRRHTMRETWWWNGVVQQAICEKRKAYRKWQKSRNEDHRTEYRNKKRLARREVAIAKRRSWEEWSRDLETPEGAAKMFKVAKQMRRERQDISGVKLIKDEQENILIDEPQIMDRWRRYFNSLLNETNPFEVNAADRVEGPIEDISEEEVRSAMKKMKRNKAPGPTGLTSYMLESLGEDGVKILRNVFQDIVRDERCPEDWKSSMTAPIYKGKGDALNCGKYRGIRLLEHGMKIYERVLEGRLKKLVKIDDRQFGFVAGKSTNDAIFIMRQLQEKFQQKKKSLYHVFVDLEKAFDRVPREVIVWALRRQGITEKLVRCVMSLYTESRSQVRTAAGTSEEFDITVGVHQGSALSPLLFITVLEEVTKECRGEGPWELLYADDLVISAESKEDALEMFSRWRTDMERRGLKINIAKTKGMVTGKKPRRPVESGRWPCGTCGRGVGANSILCSRCGRWCHRRCSGLRVLRGVIDFICPGCRRAHDDDNNGRVEEWHVAGEVLEVVDQFCYLGDVLDGEAGVERAVRARVAIAWSRWREIAGLLLNRGIPLRRRGQVYRSCIRAALLYGAENWPLTERLMSVLRACDRRMLRYMAGIRWQDHVRSCDVANSCGMEELEVELRHSRLRWLGHVERSEEEGLLRQTMEMRVDGRRPPGRPRKTWRNCVEEDMRDLNITLDMAQDRSQWRGAIRTSNPAQGT